MTTTVNPALADVILDSLNDGLYVCDKERKILYWSKSAERITGWTAAEVVGHHCRDNILVHIDKDGRPLCGEEFCPLHRCMCTDTRSESPLIVFGQTHDGGRLPMAVTVAPIHDAEGQVIGGVETFRDFSTTFRNLKRAKRIQTLAMDHDLPKDERVSFASFYLPHDMIGGDYVALRQLDADHYGFMLADVMGHGVAAALYTMHLSALWERYHPTLLHPAQFAQHLNRELSKIVKDESFATAVCGVIDAAGKSVRFTSAGGPPLLLFKATGECQEIEMPGWPFGMAADAEYEESEFPCDSADSLLIFSDAAIEVQDAAGELLGTKGLIKIMKSLTYPHAPIKIEPLHEALLTASNEIRLNDDLALLEIRWS